jgi:hypothetical protein
MILPVERSMDDIKEQGTPAAPTFQIVAAPPATPKSFWREHFSTILTTFGVIAGGIGALITIDGSANQPPEARIVLLAAGTGNPTARKIDDNQPTIVPADVPIFFSADRSSGDGGAEKLTYDWSLRKLPCAGRREDPKVTCYLVPSRNDVSWIWRATEAGLYSVTLTVTDDPGCYSIQKWLFFACNKKKSTTALLEARKHTKPVAQLVASPSEITTDYTFQIARTAAFDDGPITYEWRVDNALVSRREQYTLNIGNQQNKPLPRTVQLTVEDSWGGRSEVITHHVQVGAGSQVQQAPPTSGAAFPPRTDPSATQADSSRQSREIRGELTLPGHGETHRFGAILAVDGTLRALLPGQSQPGLSGAPGSPGSPGSAAGASGLPGGAGGSVT